MRITIEDSQEIGNLNPVQLETSSDQGAIDAGKPSLSNNLQAASIGQVSHLEEAGSPPSWLLETIGKAFTQNPGRFDAVSEPLSQVNNGGAAPSSKSRSSS